MRSELKNKHILLNTYDIQKELLFKSSTTELKLIGNIFEPPTLPKISYSHQIFGDMLADGNCSLAHFN